MQQATEAREPQLLSPRTESHALHRELCSATREATARDLCGTTEQPPLAATRKPSHSSKNPVQQTNKSRKKNGYDGQVYVMCFCHN